MICKVLPSSLLVVTHCTRRKRLVSASIPPRLKDAFDKFYGGMEKFDSLAREALCKKVLPMLDQHPAGSVQMDDFQMEMESVRRKRY